MAWASFTCIFTPALLPGSTLTHFDSFYIPQQKNNPKCNNPFRLKIDDFSKSSTIIDLVDFNLNHFIDALSDIVRELHTGAAATMGY